MGELLYDLVQKLISSNYFGLILIGFILFVILIFILIIYLNILSKRKRNKEYKKNTEKIISSLTHEEIENISKNSANPEEIKEILKVENERLKTKTAKKGKRSKATPVKETEAPIIEQVVATETKTPKKKESIKTSSTIKQKKSSNVKIPTSNEEVSKPSNAKGKKSSKHQNNKVEEVKEQPKKESTLNTNTQIEKQQYLGKWKIYKQNDRFFAELIASNGGLLLRTAPYSSLTGIKNGIETIKKNVDLGLFHVTSDKYGHYSFKLYSSTNRLICVSEDYSSKTKCENGISSFKRFAKTAILITAEIED